MIRELGIKTRTGRPVSIVRVDPVHRLADVVYDDGHLGFGLPWAYFRAPEQYGGWDCVVGKIIRVIKQRQTLGLPVGGRVAV